MKTRGNPLCYLAPPMKTRSLLFPLWAVFCVLQSCRPDPKTPNWDVQALTPLVHSRLSVGDIVADSSVETNANGFLSLVYRSPLAALKPGAIAPPLDATFQNTVKLSTIKLGERKFADAISLGELASNGSPFGQFILANVGNTIIVPALPPDVPRSFPVDATRFFQTVTFQSGDLILTIENELAVPLTDVEVRLENGLSQTLLLQKNIDTLKPRQSVTETFPLAGKTMEGALRAVLQRFSSPGSAPDSVVVDTSESIVVSVELKNLIPISATAIFPDQELTSDTTDTQLAAGDAQLTAIRIGTGKIFLDAASTIEDPLQLDYRIPSATLGGNPLELREVVPGAPPTTLSNLFSETDVSGYRVDLTGRPGSNDFNSFFAILLGRIDSTGNLINLSLDDSVFLQTGIQNLTADRGFGYLGKDTVAADEITPSATFGALSIGDFDFEEVKLSLTVENQIGAPIEFIVNSMNAWRGSDSKSLNWNQIGQTQSIPAATLSPAEIPLPGILNLQIDQSNSNLDELLEFRPENFQTSLTAFVNGSLASPDYDQFLFTDFGIDAFLDLEVPLHLSLSDLQLADTVDFDLSDYDPENRWKQGTLKLIATNNFPILFDVELVLLDKNLSEIGTLVSAETVASAVVNSEGRATEAVRSVVDIPVAESDVKNLRNARKIYLKVTTNSATPPEKIKLYPDNFLDLTLSGDLTVRTRK